LMRMVKSPFKTRFVGLTQMNSLLGLGKAVII
jgi:hypothetical protein